jgi:drug/metabolite transporter (DMT)-like permease
VAGATAVLSGISVFVNSSAVHAFHSSTVYTAAKNLVATLVLAAVSAAAVAGRRWSRAAAHWTTRPARPERPRSWPRRLGLAYVGVVGGGIAFVLFFQGLAQMQATPAAFLRDSLVLWVALAAWPLLGERLSGWNLVAIAGLVGGQVAVLGGPGHLALGQGSLLVLTATVLWAVEVVVARWLLPGTSPAGLALTRMGVGSLVLLGWLTGTGKLGALVSLRPSQLGWVALTGILLAGYVATWFTALARARAVDVTSVLVASALVTAALGASAGTVNLASQGLGLALIAAGAAVVVWTWPRRQPA